MAVGAVQAGWGDHWCVTGFLCCVFAAEKSSTAAAIQKSWCALLRDTQREKQEQGQKEDKRLRGTEAQTQQVQTEAVTARKPFIKLYKNMPLGTVFTFLCPVGICKAQHTWEA